MKVLLNRCVKNRQTKTITMIHRTSPPCEHNYFRENKVEQQFCIFATVLYTLL